MLCGDSRRLARCRSTCPLSRGRSVSRRPSRWRGNSRPRHWSRGPALTRFAGAWRGPASDSATIRPSRCSPGPGAEMRARRPISTWGSTSCSKPAGSAPPESPAPKRPSRLNRPTTEDVTRRALEAVALAFFRTVHAQERVRLLADAETTAQQVLQIATRRYESGDIAVLDVNIAKTALTRARSTRMAADADRALGGGRARAAACPPCWRGDRRGGDADR